MDSNIKIVISDKFMDALIALPKQQQKKTSAFVNKLRHNPRSTSLNLEKIVECKQKGFFSARIDQTYRAIIFQPDGTYIFMVMWVDHHDEAYDWARRHNCNIHPSTGAIQLVSVEHQEQALAPVIAAPEVTAENVPKTLLFAPYTSQQILGLGVPEPFLAQVMAVSSEDELEQLEAILPTDAYEPLYLLAAGTNYDELQSELTGGAEAVDTSDFEAALERNISKRHFKLIQDDEELEQMLNAPLDKWRVFLHPSQRKLVERDWNGPVRVSGGAGTGKTVVAMHRAKWLAERIPSDSNKKVLFTTFTKNLAADIEANLAKICSPELLAKIEVVNIDKWVHQFLRRNSYAYTIAYDTHAQRSKCWQQALDMKNTDLPLTDEFYAEEWRSVVQVQNIRKMKAYLKAKRNGRGTPLNRRERVDVWRVFEEYRQLLSYYKLREFQDAVLDAVEIIESKAISMPYTSIIVDEAQDMGNQAFSLLRKVIPEGKNDMFIVGDGHQRIYNRKVVLGHCGINIIGRGRKLKINYRTSEETRRFAVAVMQNQSVDDLDGHNESKGDYLSLFHGDKPHVEHFESYNDELDAVIRNIDTLLSEGVELKDICLVARKESILEQYSDGLASRNIETYKVSRNGVENRDQPGIRIANMHRIKGLEFQHVMIVSVNDGVVPQCQYQTSDPIEKRNLDFNERALFHVAATRAVKKLFISSYGAKSQYL